MTNEEMYNQILYWKRNPDKFAEFIIGRKLRLHEKIWMRVYNKLSKKRGV